jgi:branched-chain amino acid transport system permease protein
MGLLLPLHGSSLARIEFQSKFSYYYLILAFLILAVLVTYFVKVHRLGYFLVAIRSDPDAAASLGINITKYKLIAMVISCCLIAFGGSFYAQYFRYIGPERIFGLDLSIQIALIALIGGQGTIFGPVIGAFLIVPLGEFLANNFGGNLPGLHLFIYGILLMFVVMYLPKGVYGFLLNIAAKAERLVTRSRLA